VWKVGFEHHLLTPLPRNPRALRAPGANSKKLYLVVFYNDFGTFARKDVVHFSEKQIYAPEDPKASRRDPKGRPKGAKGSPKGDKGSQRHLKGSQRHPKGTSKHGQREPMTSQRDPKGRPEEAKGIPKGDKWSQRHFKGRKEHRKGERGRELHQQTPDQPQSGDLLVFVVIVLHMISILMWKPLFQAAHTDNLYKSNATTFMQWCALMLTFCCDCHGVVVIELLQDSQPIRQRTTQPAGPQQTFSCLTTSEQARALTLQHQQASNLEGASRAASKPASTPAI
jgi:hypothetical protein